MVFKTDYTASIGLPPGYQDQQGTPCYVKQTTWPGQDSQGTQWDDETLISFGKLDARMSSMCFAQNMPI